jgi:hypothetical protein
MICSGKCSLDAQKTIEFEGEFSCELLSSICDNLLWPSMVNPDMISEEFGSTTCTKRGEGCDKVCALSESIDNHEYSVESI